jgi:hypothetical protein
VRHGRSAACDPEDLDADVVRAGVEVVVQLAGDGVEVAPDHEVVDEPVAATAASMSASV